MPRPVPGARQPPGTGQAACLMPREVLRSADQGLAGTGQLTDLADRCVMEGGVLEILLDHARQLVPRLVKGRQCLVGGEVFAVTGAGALDALGRELEGGGAELADAGVELLVAVPERGHARDLQRPVRAGQDLGDDPAVVLVVVGEPGQVHHGGPDVGLVDPGALGVATRYRDLAAVRARGVWPLVGGTAIEAEVLDPRPGEPDEVGVDLRGVVTVVIGEAGVYADARR